MRMHPSLYPLFGLVQMIVEPQLLAKTLGMQWAVYLIRENFHTDILRCNVELIGSQ